MARPRKLPTGMWQRGNTYYARFRAGGRLVRERLSSDFKAAVTMLNDLRAQADRARLQLGRPLITHGTNCGKSF